MATVVNLASTVIQCRVKRKTPSSMNNCINNLKKHNINQVIQIQSYSNHQRKNIFTKIEELKLQKGTKSMSTTPHISKKHSKTNLVRVSSLTPERLFKTTNRVLTNQQSTTKSKNDKSKQDNFVKDNTEETNHNNKLASFITDQKLFSKNHHKHYSLNEPLLEKRNIVVKKPIKVIQKKSSGNNNGTPQSTLRNTDSFFNNTNSNNNKDTYPKKTKSNSPKAMQLHSYYTSSNIKQSQAKNYNSKRLEAVNSEKSIKQKSPISDIIIPQINNSITNQTIVVRQRDKNKKFVPTSTPINTTPSNNNVQKQLTLLSKMPSKDFLNQHKMKKKTRNSKSSIKSGNDITKNETQSEKSIISSKIIHSIRQISQTGFAGLNKTKINQDSLFIVFQAESNYHLMGICDGHGRNGHLVSQYLVESLPRVIEKEIKQKTIAISSDSNDKIKKILDNAFVSINSKLSNDCTIDTTFSGSTCVGIIFTNEKLYCANVGDSRGIIGKYNKYNNKWYYNQISRDHKPTDLDEKKRIIRFGGRISQYRDQNGICSGPQRIWLQKEDIPGLAMSRSFGDQIASKVGVTCEPEVKEVTFTEEDKFILLASDGLWEYMSNEKCIGIVSKFYFGNKDSDGAVKCLYKEAFKQWINNDLVIDDITIVLIFFS